MLAASDDLETGYIQRCPPKLHKEEHGRAVTTLLADFYYAFPGAAAVIKITAGREFDQKKIGQFFRQ